MPKSCLKVSQTSSWVVFTHISPIWVIPDHSWGPGSTIKIWPILPGYLPWKPKIALLRGLENLNLDHTLGSKLPYRGKKLRWTRIWHWKPDISIVWGRTRPRKSPKIGFFSKLAQNGSFSHFRLIGHMQVPIWLQNCSKTRNYYFLFIIYRKNQSGDVLGIISLKKSGFGPFSALAYSKPYIGWHLGGFRWIQRSNFWLSFKIQFQHFFSVRETLISSNIKFRAVWAILGGSGPKKSKKIGFWAIFGFGIQ